MQKRMVIYIALVILVLSSALLIKEKNNSDTNQPPLLMQEVYYVENETNKLVFELRNVRGGTPEEILESTLSEMRIPPKNESLSVAVPENLNVTDVVLDGNTAEIYVGAEYKDMKTSEEMFCRAAFVWTYTGLEFVDNVEIYVGGEPLTKSTGEPFGLMHRSNMVVNADIDAEPTNATRILKLYFANEDASALVAEERSVEVNPNQPVEKYVMEQLIMGPSEDSHVATVPTETKIRDIQTADGICYVDLSQEFVSKHSGGSTGEMLTVYSIVNSLCELDEVEKVQFLIEGEKQIEYKGHIEFDKPFRPMEKIISDKE